MRVLLIGGSHPRHLYFLNSVALHPAVELVGAILQSREPMLPQPPETASPHDRDLWHEHFERREAVERDVFGDPKPEFLYREVDGAALHAPNLARAVEWDAPELAIIFGCGMIREPLLSSLPPIALNVHLGLSPRYRGAATLFWPQYMLEPQWAGTTIHKIVAEPDAGEILHQSAPILKRGDGIHDVSARAVVQAAADMGRLLHRWPAWEFKQQRNTGKCFLARDFQPAHLRQVYDVWDNRIVDAFLNGEISSRPPVLWQDNLREAVTYER